MVKRFIDELLPGMVLARPVMDFNAKQALVEQGMELTLETIKSLEQRGVVEVYVSEAELEQLEKHKDAHFAERVKNLSYKARTCALTSVKDAMGGDAPGDGNPLEIEACMDQILEVLNLDKNQLVKISLTQHEEEYIFNHAVNVSVLALVLAGYLKLDEKQKRIVGEAAMLHDIGLMKMEPEQWDHVEGFQAYNRETIEKHVAYGEEILGKISGIDPISLGVVRNHHERPDGTGLPKGIDSGGLDLFTNIIAVADMFDSLTRPHDAALGMTGQEALKTLFGAMDKYDPRILRSFLGDLAMFPIGSVVQLSTGAIALVIGAVKDQPFRPLVKVITDDKAVKLSKPYELDLSLKRNFMTFIEKTIPESDVKFPLNWD